MPCPGSIGSGDGLAVRDEIARINPAITIKSITFERKLNPQRIEAVVDALVTGSAPIESDPPKTPFVAEDLPSETKAAADTVEDVVELVQPEEKPKRKKVFA